MDNNSYQRKAKNRVHLVLTNGEVLDGFIYTMPDERIVDLMNDERDFIPFRAGSRKKFSVINKSGIRSIENRQENYHD